MMICTWLKTNFPFKLPKRGEEKEKNAVPELDFLKWHSTHQMMQR